jgi:hypothetical protein
LPIYFGILAKKIKYLQGEELCNESCQGEKNDSQGPRDGSPN